MVLSGIIVDSMYLNSDSMLWLFKPLKKYQKSNDVINEDVDGIKSIIGSHICHHKNDCNTHISQVCI